MSKDKYPSIFSSQMETIVFITINIILQIFFATRTVLKIGEYINNSLHLARKYAGIFVCSTTFFPFIYTWLETLTLRVKC